MIDELEEIMDFQKMFLEIMAEIRSKNMMTFPVNTISLLRVDGKFVDEDFARYACQHNMKWNDSNLFVDDSVTSLSNCCFDGSQTTLTRSDNGVNLKSFEELFNSTYKGAKKNFVVFHNGNWVKAKPIRLPARKMYKVVTTNNKELILTDNHINLTLDGEKPTSELTTQDYLMFNTKALNGMPDAHLTYEQGFLIGMYLGDGSMDNEHEENHAPSICLSLNKEKYESSLDILRKAVRPDVQISLYKPYNNVYPVRICDTKTAEFIREYVSGRYCHEKRLSMKCVLETIEFRKGILDGYYLTDGGNSNRIYTTSEGLVNDIECLCASLGLQTIIDVSDRTGDEKVVIRGKAYNRNYPVYCIRWYETVRRHRKDVYVWRNNSIYFRIKSIQEVEPSSEYCYCFEMENEEEPYFTLPNGVITHNCRLKSNIEDLGFFNSIGGTALKVGSVKVGTVNLARLALENNTEESYLSALHDLVWLNLQMLDCVRGIIRRNVEKGLLKNFSYGLIDFPYLYNTIGVIGVYEAMKTFGYVTKDEFGNTYYTDEAAEFGKKMFDVIHNTKAEFAKGVDYQISLEQIPGETAAAKLMKKDLFFYPDTTVTDLPLYGNQFIPLGIKTTMQERIRIASMFDAFCNGGSILHVNIEAPFTTFEQAWGMLNYIADKGVTYFAFNTKIQACRHNHAFFGKTCPECGEPVETEYSRVVGFYTPVKTYSKERKAEYQMREWENVAR